MRRAWLFFAGIVGMVIFTASGSAFRPQSTSSDRSLAIIGVTVIDVSTGAKRRDQTLLIRDDRITRIGPSAAVRVTSSMREIDGTGSYAIPGLCDMHVHIFNQVSMRPANTWYFPLFVANGVLAVREMWTKPANVSEVRRWRHAVGTGALTAPRLVAVGRVLDGPDPVWQNTDVVTNPQEARRLVDETKAAGDFVKVYSKLSREAYLAIVQS
jgi:hypothetical protein